MTQDHSSAYGIAEGETPVVAERVAVADLRAYLSALFTTAGYRPEDAQLVADSLTDADARGIASHGSIRTRVYVERIRSGLVDPRAVPDVSGKGAAVRVSGNNAPGHVAALAGVQAVTSRALETGISVAGVNGSNHCGTLGYFLRQIADQGLLGIAASNGPPVMAYHGGRTRAVGTNPFGFAAPRAGQPPIVLDMATSATARGKIIHAARTGGTIPEGWAIDVDGNPTSDPAAALAGAAIPFAGPKGSGLAMMVELLCGAMVTGATGPAIGDMYEQWDRPQNVGHLFLALDPTVWIDSDVDLATRTREFGDRVHNLPAAAGHRGVLLPGELEEEALQTAYRDGLTVPGEVLSDLRALAEEMEIDHTLHTVPSDERSRT